MSEQSLEDQDPTLDLTADDLKHKQEPSLSGIVPEDDPSEQPSQDPNDVPATVVDEHGKEVD